MKKNEKEQWIDDVFDSWQGSARAVPNPDLFHRIEDQLSVVVPMRTWRIASAAAAILLLINAFVIQQHFQNERPMAEEQMQQNSYSNLISNYNIYE